MNWKNAPNLFANGKFKARSELPSMPVGEVECILHGYTNGQYRLQFSGIFDWVDVADCKLIARPIEDMTDEEIPKVLETDVYSNEYARELLKERLQKGTLLGYHERNLLSIGVYPFSDTEDVIFKPQPT